MNFTVNSLRWLETILKERYGLPLVLSEDSQGLYLKLPKTVGGIRFDTLQPEFHSSRSDFPCGNWDALAQGYTPAIDKPLPTPAMATPPSCIVVQRGVDTIVHYDILGLTYWMLSRLEEVGRVDLDDHQRFPATSCHAYQHNYLERPIVDEWLYILGQVIKRKWPAVELKAHQFSMKVSHDVDAPALFGFSKPVRFFRSIFVSIIKYKQIKGAVLAPLIRLNTREKLHAADPYNTFEWLMSINEKSNVPSAFYFICGRTDLTKDAEYELGHPAIRDLMRRIHARGHEIGLHPSYNSFQTPEIIFQEALLLRTVMKEEGIIQDHLGGRMHYLRWEHPTTLQAWNDAGMSYDTTLSYADHPGFRCGSCFEYPAFNPKTQKILKIRIRPLIAMECTIIAPRYMGLNYTGAAYEKFLFLKDSCRKVNGCFTMLWHNSHFTNPMDKVLYSNILNG